MDDHSRPTARCEVGNAMTNTSTFVVVLNRKEIARIFGRIKVSQSGCWEWQRRLNNGYGYVGVHGINNTVHRIMYAWIFGPLPVGHKWHVDHVVCNNRKCCNPSHLELVPARVNTLRGNGITAQEARRTHCGKDHTYSGDSFYIRKSDGSRRCRICRY